LILPIADRAEFTIKTFEEGNLNVALYDLAGAFIMDVISNNFINANTELKVPLSLGGLANGTYTIIVSLGNDNIVKQIIVVR
jgi:hypothetical protein